MTGRSELTQIRHDRRLGRRTYLLEADSPEAVDAPLNLRSPNFALLVACDFSALADEQIISLAERLLREGLSEVHTWGPDCERGHDLFDKADLARIESNGGFDQCPDVMSVWNSRGSLEDALWGFWFVNTFAGKFKQSTRAWVALVIGNPDWSRRAKKWLADPDRYEPQDRWVSQVLWERFLASQNAKD